MIDAKTRFHQMLEQMVEERVNSIKEDISTGIKDQSVYFRCVGEIEGLRGALRLCDDIERSLNERISQQTGD